jgi:hypothetical protein
MAAGSSPAEGFETDRSPIQPPFHITEQAHGIRVVVWFVIACLLSLLAAATFLAVAWLVHLIAGVL